MSDSQSSSVPETPTPNSNLIITDWEALLPVTYSNEPPLVIVAEGLQYERRDRPANARRSAKISPLWALGTWYIAASNGKEYEAWRCSECKALIKLAKGSPGNAKIHWDRSHSTTTSAIARASLPLGQTPPPPTPRGQRTLYTDVNIDRWRAQLLRWMIVDHVPFTQIESEPFRSLLIGLHAPIERYIVSANTIRNWLDEEYEAAVDQVLAWLQNARSRIHISFDLWTSDNGYAMVGVYAHFVSHKAFETRVVLLALRRIERKHSGEEVAAILIGIIEFWQLKEYLGVFVGDNSEVNDVAINAVLTELRPDIVDSR
jgi:hypothetical protein